MAWLEFLMPFASVAARATTLRVANHLRGYRNLMAFDDTRP